ncbi:MAG TPA: polysaccharide deacetylase [Firmicutes bacterium]|nr:polysaccharide deacetylase [Bacillota bacterium]
MINKQPLFRNIARLAGGAILLGLVSIIVATAAGVAQHGEIPGFMTGNLFTEKETPPEEQSSVPVSADMPKPPRAEKVVYLTFDDGPDPAVTPLVLQTLQQHAVPATFFVTGTQVEAHPELLRQIHAAGHAIGNHSYNHRYHELYRSPAAYLAQMERCNALIAAIIGVTPGISRAPGGTTGSFTADFWSSLEQQGFKDIGWNISSGDASSAKATQIAGNVIAQAEKNKFLWRNAIVLMHDGKGHAETAAALPAIIEYFQKQGFEFRAVDHSTPPAW